MNVAVKPIAVDLDHVGTIVRDLDRAQEAFLKLGFQLTARSYHMASPAPGAPLEPLGSGNHVAMLGQGYLEIMANTHPTKVSVAVAMLERYEGAHIVAFRPESGATVQSRLIDRGQPVDPVRILERTTPYGPDGKESRKVIFHSYRFTTSVFTEAQFVYIEHPTRDVMWQPHLLEHPNGAIALDSLQLCSADAAATARKFAPLLGLEPAIVAPGEFEFRFTNSSMLVLSPEAWLARVPAAPLPPLPAPVGFTVRTTSLRQTQDVLERNGVAFAAGSHGGIRVGAAHACGTVIHFIDNAH